MPARNYKSRLVALTCSANCENASNITDAFIYDCPEGFMDVKVEL